VTAVLADALTSGATLGAAARLANHTAARVVGKIGTVRVTLDELVEELGATG
jgi:bifunctional ADP-heptose synthase (sugar kinase/adenylyltransferase)